MKLIFILCLSLAFPLISFADVGEPTLIPPIKKIVKTSFASCALDSEALKCWGPIAEYNHQQFKADKVVDFILNTAGDKLNILESKGAGYPTVISSIFFSSSHNLSHQKVISIQPLPDIHTEDRYVYKPTEILLKYPDLDVFCVLGSDSKGNALEYCNYGYESVTYLNESFKDVVFKPCSIKVELDMKKTTSVDGVGCDNIEGKQGSVVSDDDEVRDALASFGVKYNSQSPVYLSIKSFRRKACFSDGSPKARFADSSLLMSVPASNGTLSLGVNNPRDLNSGDLLMAKTLPELQCHKFPSISYSTLSPKVLLAREPQVTEIGLTENYRKLLMYEIGMTNVKVGNEELIFTDQSGSKILSFPMESIANGNGATWGDMTKKRLTEFFKENFRSYENFYVYSRPSLDIRFHRYQIFDTHWNEITAGVKDQYSKIRRKFTVGETTYSCVGLTCYKILK